MAVLLIVALVACGGAAAKAVPDAGATKVCEDVDALLAQNGELTVPMLDPLASSLHDSPHTPAVESVRAAYLHLLAGAMEDGTTPAASVEEFRRSCKPFRGASATGTTTQPPTTTAVSSVSSDDGVLTDAELAEYKAYVSREVTDELQRKWLTDTAPDTGGGAIWTPVLVGECHLAEDPLTTWKELVAGNMARDITGAEATAATVAQTQLAVRYVCSHLGPKLLALMPG